MKHDERVAQVEKVQSDIKAWIAAGNKPTVIPFGVSGESEEVRNGAKQASIKYNLRKSKGAKAAKKLVQ